MPLTPGFRDRSAQPESVLSLEQLTLNDPHLAEQLKTTALQHYPYPKDTDPEKRLAFIQGVIDTTFGYVGGQEHALKAATAPGGELRQTFEHYSVDAAITHFTSHDNGIYSYMAAWVNRAVAAESPDWQDDLHLLVATRTGYNELDLRILYGVWGSSSSR